MRIFLALTCLSCCFCDDTENQYEENFKQISEKESQLLYFNRMKEVTIKKKKEYDQERRERLFQFFITFAYFAFTLFGCFGVYFLIKKLLSPPLPKKIEFSNPQDGLNDVNNIATPSPTSTPTMQTSYVEIDKKPRYPYLDKAFDQNTVQSIFEKVGESLKKI